MGKNVAHTLRSLTCGLAVVAACIAAFAPARRSARRPRPRTRRASAWRATAAGWRPRERRSKELQADLDKIAAERQRINARLVETAKLIQQSEAQLNLIESRLGELEAQEKHLRGSLEQRHGKISALLAAMLRMGRNPPPVMVTSARMCCPWCAAPCCWRRRFPSSEARRSRSPSSSTIWCAS